MTAQFDRLITKDFFDPIFANPLGMALPFSVYLSDCDREGLALAAMLRARNTGDLCRLPVADDRDFAEGKAWNRILETGEASPGDRFMATRLLLERVDEMVGIAMERFTDRNGDDIADPAGFRKALAPLARKIEIWLLAPSQHTQDHKLPRGTGFMDRSEDHLGNQYLVRMNGWQDMSLLARTPDAWWTPVTEATAVAPSQDDAPSPN